MIRSLLISTALTISVAGFAAAQKAADNAAKTAAQGAATTTAEAAGKAVEAASDAAQDATEAVEGAANAAAQAAGAAGNAAAQAAESTTQPATPVQPEPAAAPAAPTAPAAPEMTRTAYDDWVIVCADQAQCAMKQIAHLENGQPILDVQIEKAPAGVQSEPVLLMMTPSNALLANNVKMQIDGGGVMTAPYFVCQPQGCFVRSTLPDQLLNSLKRGATAKIAFTLLDQGEPVPITATVSLKGFTAAFNALP